MRFYRQCVLILVLGVTLCGLVVGSSKRSLSYKKSEFLAHLSLIVNQRNDYLLRQRQAIIQIYSKLSRGDAVSAPRLKWLGVMLNVYKVKQRQVNSEKSERQLLLRVNMMPVSLVLAQAINESNWGQSRFARDANNLFGMWCYKKGCGIVPHGRASGRTYEVKKYPSQADSVVAYFYNLNTNSAYRSFRIARSHMVKKGHSLSGSELASHLSAYSERGVHYVRSLQILIKRYGLDSYDEVI